jgi:hypothetical protein
MEHSEDNPLKARPCHLEQSEDLSELNHHPSFGSDSSLLIHRESFLASPE